MSSDKDKLNPDEIRRKTRRMIFGIWNKAIDLTPEKLEKMVGANDLTVLERAIIKGLLNGAEDGISVDKVLNWIDPQKQRLMLETMVQMFKNET